MTGLEITVAVVLQAVLPGDLVPVDPPAIPPVFVLTAILLLQDISGISIFGRGQVDRVALSINLSNAQCKSILLFPKLNAMSRNEETHEFLLLSLNLKNEKKNRGIALAIRNYYLESFPGIGK